MSTDPLHAIQHPIIDGDGPPESRGWCHLDEAVRVLSDRLPPHNGPIPRYV